MSEYGIFTPLLEGKDDEKAKEKYKKEFTKRRIDANNASNEYTDKRNKVAKDIYDTKRKVQGASDDHIKYQAERLSKNIDDLKKSKEKGQKAMNNYVNMWRDSDTEDNAVKAISRHDRRHPTKEEAGIFSNILETQNTGNVAGGSTQNGADAPTDPSNDPADAKTSATATQENSIFSKFI